MKKKNKKKSKKLKNTTGFKSIRVKLLLLTAAIIAVTVLSIIIVNNYLLEKYYIHQKQKVVIDVYESMNEIFDEYDQAEGDKTGLSDTEISALGDLCEKNGVTVIVASESGEVEFSYGPSKSLSERIKDMIFTQDLGDKDYIINVRATDDLNDFRRKNSYFEKKSEKPDGNSDSESSADDSEDGSGSNSETPPDKNMQMDSGTRNRENEHSVELYTMFGSSHYAIIRVAAQSIKESADIANTFLLYVGFAAMFVGGFLVFLFSRSFTKPILELARVSKKMSALDFSEKVKVRGNGDEIDILGNSINELSVELEKTISELQTANEELQKDIKLKTEVDEMRKEFISNVSHELKTPIALIQGYAEGLYDNISDDPESRQMYLEVIMDEADKMNKLVKKLLALTQIEFGNAQIYLTEFDLSSVIEGVLFNTKIISEEKGINVLYECKTPYNIYADEFQTEEIITNFVSNAINHCEEKGDEGKVIRVSLEDKGDKVRAVVYNTGNQIKEDELEKVWIKFYKIDKARTREYGGSGIGLSIVKAIAKSMNTQCGVYNADNGVCFWCEFNKTNA